ncbi:MAG: helix-turn-helix domain-containing protein [Bdellovibrionaceae bacterium]|nr:helix-turn-helix domain-containing protein [Pseudobdellovibrionaceae bacterium]
MGKKRKLNNNEELRRFGKHLEGLILKQGYSSAYDFWVQTAGDEMARASLNYLISGKREPKLLTLILLADLLEVSLSELMDF